MTDDRITIEDIRRAGYCTRGARRWFSDNGLDFAASLRKNEAGHYQGTPRAVFLATGCPMALDIVAKKDARNG